jgi:hypothetical protein
MRSAPQLQPAAIEIVPTATLAIAPLVESARVLRAVSARIRESAAPISARARMSVSCDNLVRGFLLEGGSSDG